MRIIHGRSEDVLPSLETDRARTVIITDPVWPNAPAGLFGVSDPDALFASCAQHFGRLARRAVIVLGIASDPRFLRHIPTAMPFVRVCWLRLACPSYMGTVLNSGDVAYVFGSREAGQGFTVMSGETTATEAGRAVDWHPTPRKYEHMLWLVKQCTREGDTVLDPFCGSGTTLAAARACGRTAVHEELRVTRVHGTISAGLEATWHQLSTWSRAANGAYRQSAVVTLRADDLDAVLTVLCREQS